jgi:hypothetical protein
LGSKGVSFVSATSDGNTSLGTERAVGSLSDLRPQPTRVTKTIVKPVKVERFEFAVIACLLWEE